MNTLLTTFAAGQISGSEILFWLVVILIILGIIWFVRRI